MSFVIGKNAAENTDLIKGSFDYDIWFHVKDKPSPHLILRNPEILSLETLRQTGTLYLMALELKKHSKYKKEGNVEFMYCYVKNLTMTSIPGLVKTINKPKTLSA
jgi:predicted ribosome quality control (RQC) complex YloA/Tae2 family protein